MTGSHGTVTSRRLPEPVSYTSAVNIEEIVVQVERIVRVGLTALLTYMIAVWLAAIWWALQDIRARSTSVSLQIAATMMVIAFNFPGLLVYFMLRPQRTLAQMYGESLEEEALIRTVNEASVCPSCEHPVESDFLFCPWCQARLRQQCQRCERPILLRWRLCPYCGSAPAAVSLPPAPAIVAEAPVAAEAPAAEPRVEARPPAARAPARVPSSKSRV